MTDPLYPFDTETHLNPDWLKTGMNSLWRTALKNYSRQLLDGAVVHSADQSDIWGEAYIDSDGRHNSVFYPYLVVQEQLSNTPYLGNNEKSVYYSWYDCNKDNAYPANIGIYAFGSGNTTRVDISITGVGIVATKNTSGNPIRVGFSPNDFSQLPQQGDEVAVIVTHLTGSDKPIAETVTADNVGTLATLKTGTFNGQLSRCSRSDSSQGYQYWNIFEAEGAAATNALFDTDKFVPTCGDTDFTGHTTVSQNVGDPENAFDNDVETVAQSSAYGSDFFLGKTFASKYIKYFQVYYSVAVTARTMNVQTYDGATWTTVDSFTGSSVGGLETFLIDDTVQGIRIQTASYTNGTDIKIAWMKYSEDIDGGDIVHEIPSGTTESVISSAIGSPIVEDWETDGNVKFKLISVNGEDSGWIDKDEIKAFTTFTGEAKYLIVRLVPKSTSPTLGTPSLRSFAFRGQ